MNATAKRIHLWVTYLLCFMTGAIIIQVFTFLPSQSDNFESSNVVNITRHEDDITAKTIRSETLQNSSSCQNYVCYCMHATSSRGSPPNAGDNVTTDEIQRQGEIAAQVWEQKYAPNAMNASEEPRGNYSNQVTLTPPLISAQCNDLSARLSWPGVCTSVGHRQKHQVTLTISQESWLASE
jgi:hypothetical protein